MAGYAGYSMSNNAVDAHDAGRVPASAVTAATLTAAGLPLTVAQFRRGVAAGVIRSGEWHHTSKHFNPTAFFDLADLAAELAEGGWSIDDIPAEPCATPERRVTLTFDQWEGSHTRGSFVRYVAAATVRANWAHLDDGGKKRLDGAHIVKVEDL
jgi:hypothetical protein